MSFDWAKFGLTPPPEEAEHAGEIGQPPAAAPAGFEMPEGLTESLAQFNREMQVEQAIAAEVGRRLPEVMEGQDESGLVRVTLDQRAAVTRFDIAEDWDTQLAAADLPARIRDAVADAGARMAAESERLRKELDAQNFERSVRVQPLPESRPSDGRDPMFFGQPRKTIDILQDLFALADEQSQRIAEMGAAQQRRPLSAERVTEQGVRVIVGIDGFRSCSIPEAYARKATGAQLSAALMEAYRAAVAEFESGGGAATESIDRVLELNDRATELGSELDAAFRAGI